MRFSTRSHASSAPANSRGPVAEMTSPGAPASGEDSLIARYFKPLATDPGAFGLTDDPPQTIAKKALRVNLSDLAAKGATPAGFVLTLALRKVDETKVDEAWLAAFARGLGEDTGAFNCPLLGGDTVSTPGPLMVSITAFGRVAPGKMVHRSGAKPGDQVLVTGTIGDAALGLDILRKGRVATALANDAALRDMLIGRYRVPEPRNALASAIRADAHAAMDVSDGLAGDLAKLCAASAVSAAIELAAIPLSKAASAALTAGAVTMAEIVSGGDDYEILCTVAPDVLEPFVQAANVSGIAVNRIGTIVAGKAAPKFLDAKGAELALTRTSFSHF